MQHADPIMPEQDIRRIVPPAGGYLPLRSADDVDRVWFETVYRRNLRAYA